MNPSLFALHDISAFPIVRLQGERTRSPGYSAAWCQEMDLLISSRDRFILIYAARQGDEPHDDRVARGLWLKKNRESLAERCLALIVVEPDAERRAEMEAAFPNLVRAFGTPQAARATDQDAVDLARHLLAGGNLNAE